MGPIAKIMWYAHNEHDLPACCVLLLHFKFFVGVSVDLNGFLLTGTYAHTHNRIYLINFTTD